MQLGSSPQAINVADQVSEALLAVYFLLLSFIERLVNFSDDAAKLFQHLVDVCHSQARQAGFNGLSIGADVTEDAPPSQAGLNPSPGVELSP